MRVMTPTVLLLGVCVGVCVAQDGGRTAESYAGALIDEASADQLRAFHDWTAGEPHDAGLPGGRRQVEHLVQAFESFGLEVERQSFMVYLAHPGEASVRVVAPVEVELPLRERVVEGDEFSRNEAARSGWNAYSGSGDVTAGVVYANYGRLEDFKKLDEMGVSCAGKIVIARYGGNYRGYKAKYAEEAGAEGLIIYTDPEDAGYRQGLEYPRGGYANETSIQRGSIKTLDYEGDPLTPGVAAVDGVDRLDPSEVEGLPTIPVQPIGWGAASEILSRMEGEEAPQEWQGALAFRYMVTGGDELRVNLKVEQTREMTEISNVVARLEGEKWPEEEVFIGCHHDAWGFGASDPTSGLICVLEAARVMAKLADDGWRPARSVVFCAWDAEEQGLVGSTEFVERDMQRLTEHAVAYINLDAAANGPQFGASASPSLWDVIFEAAGQAPAAGDPSKTVLEEWTARSGEQGPEIDALGGGSDHEGFLCHACVPSMDLHGSGARGTAYHSLYDDLAWYRKVVGEDYESALMVTRMTLAVTARLAWEGTAPLRVERYAEAIVECIGELQEQIEKDGPFDEETKGRIRDAHTRVRESADGFATIIEDLRIQFERAPMQLRPDFLDKAWLEIERSWCAESFGNFDNRPWFRNAFAAPDATSGYASWVLPGLQYALYTGDVARYLEQCEQLTLWFVEAVRLARARMVDAMLESMLSASDLPALQPSE
ncbi:MAG: M20/M25/M40 family metallo-hydrolase [Phycisphaerales bacterium]